MTMVYVTHDQTEAMTMADRVVLMRDGRIEQNGTPEELYNRPATAFTARFIGTPPMNIDRAGRSADRRAPEHIRIVSQGGHPARVKAVEHLGADSIVLCEMEGQSVSRAAGRLQQIVSGRRYPARLGCKSLNISSTRHSERRLETAASEMRRCCDLRSDDGTGAIDYRRREDMKIFGRMRCWRRRFAALLLDARPAASPSILTMYYPVAVGGPVTKIIDDMVAALREGKRGHQGDGGLCRQLHRHDDQGA